MSAISRRATAGRLVVVLLVLVALVIGWGLLLTHPLARSVGAADDDLARWIAAQRTPALGRVADVGTFLGGTVLGIAALPVIGAVVAWRLRSWRPLVFVVVAYGGLLALYLTVTALVPRDRPPVKILDPGLVPDHSFPSGHVMTSVAIVGCVIALTRTYRPAAARWTWPLVLVPPLTLVSRLYQGAHHLTDTLTSLVVATVWVTVVARELLVPRPGTGR